MSGLLITGTDTGVGKTFVAAGLARWLRGRGCALGVMKPAETGHSPSSGLWPPDARTLVMATGGNDPIGVVVPYVFEPAVAPLVAARRCGRPIEVERLRDAYERLEARHDFVLVEGAGGLSVPLAEFGEGDRLFDFADLAKLFDIPLLIVSRAHLGTLNHTALTVEYARARGCRVVGIVLNGLDVTLGDDSVEDNPQLLEEMTGVPVLGSIERQEGVVDVGTMASACERALDFDLFAQRLKEAGVDLQISGESSEGTS